MKYIIVLLLSALQTAPASNYPVSLGTSIVFVQKYWRGKGKVFVHLHQNETTALQAAKKVMRHEGGSLLTLAHSGERNIVFYLSQRRYEFDPNRIFTDTGIKKTLQQFGNYSPEAHKEVKKLSNKIKQLLPEGKIIAVHNNQSYSLKDYFPGHDLADDAKALHYSRHAYYRNFYLVTKKEDFVRLTQSHFNSIWQAINATDDGSLSVYLSDREYINVEAGYGQLSEQIKMLQHA